MKTLSPDLQAHLDGGATQLCWCWRLTRADGAQLGFTDHDRDLSFDGTAFEAASGFSATDIKDGVGLNVDNLDVSGALSSAALNEGDLAAGVFDDARVEIWRVRWDAPDQRVLMRTGSLGEVRREGGAFTAECAGWRITSIRSAAAPISSPAMRIWATLAAALIWMTRPTQPSARC